MLNFMAWLVVGGLTGWVASELMGTDNRRSLFINVVVGAVGAFGGALLLSLLAGAAPDWTTFSITTLLLALIGAVGLLGVTSLIRQKGTRPADTPVMAAPPAQTAVPKAASRWDDEGGASPFENVNEETRALQTHPESPASEVSRSAAIESPSEYAHLYPEYQAVVTAHFPDRESGFRAREQLAAMPFQAPAQVVQWFERDIPATPVPGAPVEQPVVGTALIVQMADGMRGDEIVRLCQAAGATLATHYPARSVLGASRGT